MPQSFGSGGGLFPTVKYAQTKSISTTGTFSGVVVRADVTNYLGLDDVTFFATADGGTTWDEVTLNEPHSFSTTGSDLRIKVRFGGTGGSNTYVENLEVGTVINNWRLSYGEFNGSDRYISVTDHADLDITGDISICLAVKVSSLPGAEKWLLSKYDGTDGYGVRINASNEVELFYNDSGSDTTFSTGVALVKDTWQFVVFTKSTTALIAYVNGVSVDTDTGGASIGANASALYIGKYSTTYFSGSIDEVRVYNDVLTPAEIANINNHINHTSSMKLYLSMDNPLLGNRFGSRKKIV